MPELKIIADSLARNTKRVRQARGLSLDKLAARAGVSRGILIQIEAARTNPSLGTVIRVADALGVSIAQLLDYSDAPTVRITADEDAVVLWHTEAGSQGRLLAGTEAPGPLELWSWRLMPGERHDSDPHPVGTAELVRVDEGELTLVLDGHDHVIPAGSTASYESHVAHTYANNGSVPTVITLVVSVPPPR
ncbi:helix-turn-helix domain-containing protein [Yinghuangia seranimata]|uniref:helix-turn-helix domain-containing protein n=1 Tax=Yinghuangia seranimata TaxID=408067 RepID=UPI00248C4150|nr:XRE family transcriptional regulator [Yinghuangia seranimata]MDI2124516.1 XRE family transcriptional regulator [Yinghuangia seranimata]